VYRIRIVSEDIAKTYAKPGHEVLEYDAPIVTREEHVNAIEKLQSKIYQLSDENDKLRHALPSSVNAMKTDDECPQGGKHSWEASAAEPEIVWCGKCGAPQEEVQ
jgi:hypothetical protein